MSNFTKEIPKGSLAASVLFISLFFVQVIVETILRLTAYEEGQPSWAWSIGGSLLIIGIVNVLYSYRKYKAGDYSNASFSGEAIIPSITPGILDRKLFRRHLYVGIFIVIMASMLFALARGPFTVNSSRITYIVTGVLLLVGAILNFIIYGKKPKRLGQKYLEKRAKKAAKKGY